MAERLFQGRVDLIVMHTAHPEPTDYNRIQITGHGEDLHLLAGGDHDTTGTLSVLAAAVARDIEVKVYATTNPTGVWVINKVELYPNAAKTAGK